MTAALLKLRTRGKRRGKPSTKFGPTGFNLGRSQLSYYGTGFPFLDRFKTSDLRDVDYTLSTAPLNADLYPTAMPTSGKAMKWLINVEGPLGPSGVLQNYVIETNHPGLTLNFNYATKTADVTDSQTGVRRISLDCSNPYPDTGYRIEMNATAMTTAFVAGTHYIRMFRADEEARFKSGQIFTQQFLSRMALVNVLRFMDWVPANATEVRSWTDRAKPTWASYATNKGVPLEVMIALCNQTNSHMYINIPAQVGVTAITSTGDYGFPTQVTDDINIAYAYVDNMANMINSTLDPSLLCGVEFGNENWNTQFQQYFYLRSFRPLLLTSDRPDYEQSWTMAGYRSALLIGHMMKTLNYSSRFLPLFCTFAVSTTITDYNKNGFAKAVASWGNSSSPYYDAQLAAKFPTPGALYTGGLGLTSYFNGGIAPENTSANDKAKVKSWAQDPTDSGIMSLIRQYDIGDQLEYGNTNSVSNFVNLFSPNINAATAMGMTWFAYEGNFELPAASGNIFPDGTADDLLTRSFYTRAYNHPAFRALMLKMLKTCYAQGCTLNDILADAGNEGDKYATLTSAYGVLTPRGLGMQDFLTDNGPPA